MKVFGFIKNLLWANKMNKYAIHINCAGATFVKEYDFFVSQGGLKEKWGKAWKIIEAKDLDDARVKAIQEPGANAGLYCRRCGKDSVKCKGHEMNVKKHCDDTISKLKTTRIGK